MSCQGNFLRNSICAAKSGISTVASKSASITGRLPQERKAALTGGAAAISLVAAVAVVRGLGKLADSKQQATATDINDLPEIAPRRPTRPVSPTELPEDQPPARDVPALSTPPHPPALQGTATTSQPPTVELVPQAFDMHAMGRDGSSRLIRLEKDAFAVTKAGEETGLAVVREPAGSWNVAHVETGMSLAGNMDSVYEAEGLAALLVPIDWNRPFDELPQADLKSAGNIIGKYQAQLEGIKSQLGLQGIYQLPALDR